MASRLWELVWREVFVVFGLCWIGGREALDMTGWSKVFGDSGVFHVSWGRASFGLGLQGSWRIAL